MPFPNRSDGYIPEPLPPPSADGTRKLRPLKDGFHKTFACRLCGKLQVTGQRCEACGFLLHFPSDCKRWADIGLALFAIEDFYNSGSGFEYEDGLHKPHNFASCPDCGGPEPCWNISLGLCKICGPLRIIRR